MLLPMSRKPKIWPRKQEHRHIAKEHQLSEEEAKILQILEESLTYPETPWHIFVKPQILGHCPDFLVLSNPGKQTNAYHGCTIIDVKDWSKRYRCSKGKIEVFTAGEWELSNQDPLEKRLRQRQVVVDRFAKGQWSDNAKIWHATKSCILLPRMPEEKAKQILLGGTRIEEEKDKDRKKQTAIYGTETFRESLSRQVLEDSANSTYNAREAERLYEALIMPADPANLRLSGEARRLIKRPAKTRRIRGAAGTGKTTAIAAHAARNASKGMRCLIVTYNITLAHQIRRLVQQEARYLAISGEAEGDSDINHNRIDITSFHKFAVKLGMCPLTTKEPKETDEAIRRWLRSGRTPKEKKYKAIFVDEGQDFKLDWWNMLRLLCLEEGGQITVAADTIQNLYNRNLLWLDEHAGGEAGFSGPEATLEECYRLPDDMVSIAGAYAKKYLKADPASIPEKSRDQQHKIFSSRKWINIDSGQGKDQVIQSAVEAIKDTYEKSPVETVGFITASHQTGKQIEQMLQKEGIPLETVFHTGSQREKRYAKNQFQPYAKAVKGCTIHSFKGWEIKNLIIVHENEDEDGNPFSGDAKATEIYVAMTRIKRSDGGNNITVINAVPETASFKEIFEN